MPSYLILGAGDFSRALELSTRKSEYNEANARMYGLHIAGHLRADPRAQRLRAGIQVTATELLTQQRAEDQYRVIDRAQRSHLRADYRDRLLALHLQGVNVRFGIDATQLPPTFGTFDKIIFENPHSGRYGSPGNHLANMTCVESNTHMLRNIMQQVSQHLNPDGIFELHVCGWPYMSRHGNDRMWDVGMQLENAAIADQWARAVGLRFREYRNEPNRTVSRNDGSPFAANVLVLIFQKPAPRQPAQSRPPIRGHPMLPGPAPVPGYRY